MGIFQTLLDSSIQQTSELYGIPQEQAQVLVPGALIVLPILYFLTVVLL